MGNVLTFVRDGLASMVAGLGTERDKAASVYYTDPVIDQQQLVAAYRSAWLPRKIVDIPALDSCRNWLASIGYDAQLRNHSRVRDWSPTC